MRDMSGWKAYQQRLPTLWVGLRLDALRLEHRHLHTPPCTCHPGSGGLSTALPLTTTRERRAPRQACWRSTSDLRRPSTSPRRIAVVAASKPRLGPTDTRYCRLHAHSPNYGSEGWEFKPPWECCGVAIAAQMNGYSPRSNVKPSRKFLRPSHGSETAVNDRTSPSITHS